MHLSSADSITVQVFPVMSQRYPEHTFRLRSCGRTFSAFQETTAQEEAHIAHLGMSWSLEDVWKRVAPSVKTFSLDF